MAATYTHTLCANFGAARTGQATNVVAKVYDAGSTLRATVTAWSEDTDGTNGLGSYRGTFAADPAWSGGRVVYSVTGLGGVGYTDPFVADPVAAGIQPNAASGTDGGLATVDASNNVHGLQTTDAIAAAVWSDASEYAPDTKGAGVEKANKLTVTDNGRAGAVLIDDPTGQVVVPTTLPPADSVSVSSETIEVSDN